MVGEIIYPGFFFLKTAGPGWMANPEGHTHISQCGLWLRGCGVLYWVLDVGSGAGKGRGGSGELIITNAVLELRSIDVAYEQL